MIMLQCFLRYFPQYGSTGAVDQFRKCEHVAVMTTNGVFLHTPCSSKTRIPGFRRFSLRRCIDDYSRAEKRFTRACMI
jgi:hypothetical protein